MTVLPTLSYLSSRCEFFKELRCKNEINPKNLEIDEKVEVGSGPRELRFCPSLSNRRCVVYDSIWKDSESLLNYHITGNRFLHHMVRYLVGTMIEIGKKKFSLKKFEELLII